MTPSCCWAMNRRRFEVSYVEIAFLPDALWPIDRLLFAALFHSAINSSGRYSPSLDSFSIFAIWCFLASLLCFQWII